MNYGDFKTQYFAELSVVLTLFVGWFFSTFFDVISLWKNDKKNGEMYLQDYIDKYKICGIKRIFVILIDKIFLKFFDILIYKIFLKFFVILKCKISNQSFIEQQVNDPQQVIKEYLIKDVAKKRSVTCFSDTAEKGLKVKWSRGYLRSIGGMLDNINNECAKNGLPCLGCLVCKKWLLYDKMIPNSGFYGSAKKWEKEYEKKYEKGYLFCNFDDNSDYESKILPYIQQCWKCAKKGKYDVLLKSNDNGKNKTKNKTNNTKKIDKKN